MVVSVDSSVPRTLGLSSLGIGCSDNTQPIACEGCVLLRQESCKQCGKLTLGPVECRFSCPTCLKLKFNARFCCKACFQQVWKLHRGKHAKSTSKNMLQTVAPSLTPSIVSKLNAIDETYDERTWSLLSCFTIANTILHIQTSLSEVTRFREHDLFKSLMQVWMEAFYKEIQKGQNTDGLCEAVSISEGVNALRSIIRRNLSGALLSALPQLLDQHFITSNGKPLKENDRKRILREQPNEVAAQYLGHVSDEIASLFTAIVRMCRCAEPLCPCPEKMLNFCLSLLHFNRNAVTVAISMVIVKDPTSDRMRALLDAEPDLRSGDENLCQLVANLVLPLAEASEKQVYCFREVEGRQTATPFQATKEFRTAVAWYLWNFVLEKTYSVTSVQHVSSTGLFDEQPTEDVAADFIETLKKLADLRNLKHLEEEMVRKKHEKRDKKRQKRQNAKKQARSISIDVKPEIKDSDQPVESAVSAGETAELPACISSTAETACSSNSTASEEGANERSTRSGASTTEAPDILTDEDGEETPRSWTTSRNENNYQAWEKRNARDAEESNAIDTGTNKIQEMMDEGTQVLREQKIEVPHSQKEEIQDLREQETQDMQAQETQNAHKQEQASQDAQKQETQDAQKESTQHAQKEEFQAVQEADTREVPELDTAQMQEADPHDVEEAETQDAQEEAKKGETNESPCTPKEQAVQKKKKTRSAAKREKRKAWRDNKRASENAEACAQRHVLHDLERVRSEADADAATHAPTAARVLHDDTSWAAQKPAWVVHVEKKKAQRLKMAALNGVQNTDGFGQCSTLHDARVEDGRSCVGTASTHQLRVSTEHDMDKTTWSVPGEETRGWRKRNAPWSTKLKGEASWAAKMTDTRLDNEKVCAAETAPRQAEAAAGVAPREKKKGTWSAQGKEKNTWNERMTLQDLVAENEEVSTWDTAAWSAKGKETMVRREKIPGQSAIVEIEKVSAAETTACETQAGANGARGQIKALWNGKRDYGSSWGKKNVARGVHITKSSTAKSSTDAFPLLQDTSPTVSKSSSAGSVSPLRDSDNAWGLPHRRVSASPCNFGDIMMKFRGIRTELNDPNGKYRGISNKGNCCYVIALMQALFLSTKFLEDLFDKQEQSKVATALRNHMARMFVSSEESIDVEGVLDTLPPWLNDGTQQDAMETVRYLLSELQESTSTFRGSSSITTMCTICGCSSTKDEIMQEISLPCKENMSVEEILRQGMEPELLTGDNQWYCGACMSKVDAYRTWRINDAPQTLCINLNRFRWENCDQVKDCTFVQLKPNLRVADTQYQLYAFVVHSGRESIRGHYYAVGARSTDVQWRTFDDQAVRAIARTSVGDYGRTTAHGMMAHDVPYILFYKKV